MKLLSWVIFLSYTIKLIFPSILHTQCTSNNGGNLCGHIEHEARTQSLVVTSSRVIGRRKISLNTIPILLNWLMHFVENLMFTYFFITEVGWCWKWNFIMINLLFLVWINWFIVYWFSYIKEYWYQLIKFYR